MGSQKAPDYTKSAEIERAGRVEAANIAAQSEAEARALQEKLYNQSRDYLNQQEEYNRALVQQNQSNYQPYVQAGQDALSNLQGLYQNEDSWLNKQYDMQKDPGYAFREQQGQDAINKSLAAKSGVLSSNAVKQGQEYASNLASQEYGAGFARDQLAKQNRYNALMATLNTGLQGTSGFAGVSTPTQIGSQLAGLTGNYGDSMTNIISQGANTQAGLVMQGAQRDAYYNQLGQQKSGNGLMGALSGAASGAAAGSAAGPWGALAGGVIGGAGGYMSGSAAGGQQIGNASGNAYNNLYNFSAK